MPEGYEGVTESSWQLSQIVVEYSVMETPSPFTCTSRFEERDFAFLATLVTGKSNDERFFQFVADREELLLVLDDRRVLDALLASPSLLNVSPALYFYVLVRHSLLRSEIDDPELAEYLGALLAERVHIGPANALKGIPSGFVHTVDFMAVLDQVSGDTRYELLVAAGNQFLVLTGIFPDYVRQRSKRHGAPGISYYEGFARSSFLEAQHYPRARKEGVDRVLDTLTQVLPEARRSLNKMADSLLFLSS